MNPLPQLTIASLSLHDSVFGVESNLGETLMTGTQLGGAIDAMLSEIEIAEQMNVVPDRRGVTPEDVPDEWLFEFDEILPGQTRSEISRVPARIRFEDHKYEGLALSPGEMETFLADFEDD
jgi:hypothetical protein